MHGAFVTLQPFAQLENLHQQTSMKNRLDCIPSNTSFTIFPENAFGSRGGPINQPYLTISVHIWLHMAAYACVWLHMAAYGCIWLHMAPYGCIWLHMAAYGCIGLHMAAYGCIWVHMVAPSSLHPPPSVPTSYILGPPSSSSSSW